MGPGICVRVGVSSSRIIDFYGECIKHNEVYEFINLRRGIMTTQILILEFDVYFG